MIQTFFLGILLFFNSILAPLIYNIPTGPVDYGGGFGYAKAQVEIANPLYLFKDGETGCFLVTPDEVSPTIETGVKWIQDFIGRMTGKTFQRKTASQVLPGDKYIAIGLPALGGFEAEASALGDEDYIKRVVDGNVFISGNGRGRGNMYGCASFIEDQLGCRWFTPTLKVAPESKDVIIDALLDDTQVALLDYRDNYWPYVYLYPEFKAFHRSNTPLGSYIDKDGNHFYMSEEYGRAMEYFSVGFTGTYADAVPPGVRTNHYGGFCHAMHNLVPRALYYGDYSNPIIGEQAQDQELFAFRKDQNARSVGQRCLTNPKVFELTKLAVFACIEAHVDDMNFRWVSVEHEDNGDYCQCPGCEASDARLGGLSGTNVWFANKIARAVAERFPQRPDIRVCTFAYSYTTAPPTITVPGPEGNIPEGNVAIRMCSIECCFNHPIRDCGGSWNTGIFADMTPKPSKFAQYMIDWGKLCGVNGAEITIWDYNTCFEFYPAIYPNLHVLADNLQLFVENNAKGVFSEGYDNGGVELLPGSVSGEFGELRAYMLAKLLWNPYLNSNQIMDEFMNAYYGEASAPYIKEFIDFYTNKAIGTNHTGVFGRAEKFTYMNIFECKRMEALFDKAEALAGNEEQLLHIKQSRLCLKLYQANMMLGDYSWFNPRRLQNNKDLFYECVLLGVDRFSAYMVEPYNTYVWLHRPYDWAKMRSWIDFVDESKLVRMDLEAYRAEHTL